MKLLYTLLFLLALSLTSKSQQFLWAQSYAISNCNEVAALAVSENGNIFISGVHDTSVFLPYTGNCYIHTTDPEGEVIWTEYLSGSIQIGDMATVGNSVVIIGQSNGPFTYQAEEYGPSGAFMFVIQIDSIGSLEWYYTDEAKYGANTNIAVGEQGNIALQVRGQSNLGDWVMILDAAGNILNTKEISTTQTILVDIAYYDGRVYLNGGFFAPGSIVIDTVFLELPALENATFVLALNQDLVAEWGSVKSTINNRDGRIEANASGVFVYEEILTPPFTIVNTIRKFSFDGEVLALVEAPVFTNAITLYPDMTLTPTLLGLFVHDDFSFNSHKVILFDHDLNILSEKVVSGTSDLYSGQISHNGDDLYIAHVYSDNLNFDNELTLPYTGSGKLPYIAKLGSLSITDVPDDMITTDEFLVYPNPADKKITISLTDMELSEAKVYINDLKGYRLGKKIIDKNSTTIDINHLPAGVYIIEVISPDKGKMQRKILIR